MTLLRTVLTWTERSMWVARPTCPPNTTAIANKNRNYYTDSEWDSEPWTPVTSKPRKHKTKTSSGDKISLCTPGNSGTDHSMKDSDDDSASTSFQEILNQLNNHTMPKTPPPQTKTKSSLTLFRPRLLPHNF